MKIEYKGQYITINTVKTNDGRKYKYTIKYFPNVILGRCAWKMLEIVSKAATVDEVKKEIKDHIDLEFEQMKWRKPTEEIFEGYIHEE